MPQPISSTNSSYYDPNAQFSQADTCDSEVATCGPTAEAPASAASAVSVPPIVITGDAGARQLVKQLEASRPDCELEARSAALSCAKAGVSALAGAAAATSVVGALPAIALTVLESVSCGKDLRSYYDCERP